MSNLTVISSDTHAGAPTDEYKDYLDSSWHEEFEAWREKYRNPFQDLTSDTKNRNWDTDRRKDEQYGDGVVAEVIFPNTIPPFFPTGQLLAPYPKKASDYDRRLAGIRAHNRWLKDFCDELPGQRVGLPQVFLNNVDDAVEDAVWAAENGFRSILVPAVAPDTEIAPLFTDTYDPLWATCQEHGLVVTQHGGGGTPNYGRNMATPFLMLMEIKFFTNRSVWHLILSGVFERFPELKFVMTEQGVDWVPPTLDRMDEFWAQSMRTGKVGELNFDVGSFLPKSPSDYFRRNCFVGNSFPSPLDGKFIREVGLENIMWGSDYPHDEGTFPHSKQSLQLTFEGWNEDDLNQVLSRTAASVYGFDLDQLAPLAAEHGPSLELVQTKLTDIPDNDSPAFTRR